MKRFRTNIIICLVMLMSATILSSISFAGTGSPEQPPGEPPYGVAIQSDAAGAKLYGTITIEYRSLTGNCFDSTIVLRLRKGHDLKTFVASGCLAFADPGLQQQAITMLMKDQILNYFFNGDTSLDIKLISLGEYVLVPVPATQTCPHPEDPANTCHDEFMMADITIAVK